MRVLKLKDVLSKTGLGKTSLYKLINLSEFPKCPIPCDHIPRRSWSLFQAREVMRSVVESFKREQCT